jgi:hypothetical protein
MRFRAGALHLFATLSPERFLEGGKMAYFETGAEPPITGPP